MVNLKQLFGLILLSLGVVLVIFAFDQKGYVLKRTERQEIHTNSPVNPVDVLPEGGTLEVSHECLRSNLLLAAGLTAAFIGGLIAVACRSKNGA